MKRRSRGLPGRLVRLQRNSARSLRLRDVAVVALGHDYQHCRESLLKILGEFCVPATTRQWGGAGGS